jgi:hypothetical protein
MSTGRRSREISPQLAHAARVTRLVKRFDLQRVVVQVYRVVCGVLEE